MIPYSEGFKKPMAKSAFAKRLAGMQKKYEAAQAPAGFGETNLEPGKYRATIGAELKDISGKMMIEWKFTVVEGDFEGESSTQLDSLENDNSFGYLKKRLKMFGYDPDDLNLAEQLETILEEITSSEPVGVIQVKQNGEYLNTYLNKVELDADEDDVEEAAAEEEDAAEDEDENDSEEEESEDEEAEEEAEEEEEEEEEEASIEKGSVVLYQKPKAKKAEEFEVLSVDEKKKTAKLKGIPTAVPLAELSLVEAEEEEEEEEEEVEEEEAEEEVEDVSDDEEDDDESVELEVGAEVSIDVKGRPMKGKVLSIDADSETAKVKSHKDGKTYKVSFEQITAL